MTRYNMELADLAVVIPVEYHHDIHTVFAPAIQAVRQCDPDRIIYNEDGSELARAYQIVRLFDLGGFVTERQRVDS